jgi:hypothetical protein
MNIYSYESALSVLAACLASLGVFAVAAISLSRAALHRFDRVVGRPHRATNRSAPRLRWWLQVLVRRRKSVAIASIVVVFLFSQIISSMRVARSLSAALQETDRLCPEWRLDDLEAARRRIPDARNGALRLSGAAHLLPTPWRTSRTARSRVEREMLDAIVRLAPVQRLSLESRESLQAAVDLAAPALEEALGLADLPTGRFPIQLSVDGFSTLLPHLETSREVANLLLADAILESEAGKTDASLKACLAILNAGRSIGDEPTLVSQRRRMELGEKACRQIERTLAQGQASAIALAALQSSLDDEEDQPLLVYGLRGERALMDRFLSAVESGDFTREQLRSAGFAGTDLLRWNTTQTRAVQLRFDNRAEQVAMLPAEQQYTAFMRLQTDAKNLPFASRMLVPAFLQVATASLSSRARLRCASAALGCERFRLARGRWPATLEELVPEFLKRPPIDPFDGKPIRFRCERDQVLVYSVGADRRDDGGRTETAPPSTVGKDLEFRLWDPTRGQPSAPGR